MIRGIHHTAICTADLDRLVAFYRDVVGFEVVTESQWAKNDLIDAIVGLKNSSARQVMMRAGNAYLELFQYGAPQAREAEPLRPCDRGYTHICLEVVDIRAEHKRLTEAGMRFNRSPVDFGELSAVYGSDPDGNIVEILETTPAHAADLTRLEVPTWREPVG
jgi:catechol 2,3-dioxygenase-like lactoylglutathione lyase family enzyme